MAIFRPGVGKEDIYSLEAGCQKILGKNDAGVTAYQANIGQLEAFNSFRQFAKTAEHHFDRDHPLFRMLL